MKARRTLVVVRHAKSDWSHGLPDIERPLADRGRRDAPLIGRWLSENLDPVQLVVCSPAKRARQTWQLAGARLEPRPPVRNDDRLYTANPTDLLTVLAELPDETRSVVLVGHNPALSDLVEFMTGQLRELKTSAIAVLTWPGSWLDAESRSATLNAFTTPRG
jgi:phosphohistidine phosphatase